MKQNDIRECLKNIYDKIEYKKKDFFLTRPQNYLSLTFNDSIKLQNYYSYCKPLIFYSNDKPYYIFEPKYWNFKKDVILRILPEKIDKNILLFLIAQEFEDFGINNIFIHSELISEFIKLNTDINFLYEFLKFIKIKQIKENIEFFEKINMFSTEKKFKILAADLRKDIIEILMLLNQKLQDFIIELFLTVNFSLNDKIAIVNSIFDCIQSNKISAEKLISDIEKNKSPQPKLLKFIKELRFPILSEIQQTIEKAIKEFSNKNVSLNYDNTLENDEMTMCVRFKNYEEFEKAVEHISAKKESILFINEKKNS